MARGTKPRNTKASKAKNAAADDGSQPQKAEAAVASATSNQRVVGGGLPEAGTVAPEQQAGSTSDISPGQSEAGAVEAAAAPDPLDGALGVSIVGPKRGRWRAGRHFTPEPTVIALDELSLDEQAAIAMDPELKVTPLNHNL